MKRAKENVQKAFSLLEVLIALVIMSIGMLGIARMLLISHKSTSSSYLRQQAIQSGYDIIDRMRANRPLALSGNYNTNNLVTSGAPSIPNAPSTDCTSAICSPTQLAIYDIWYWLAHDVSQLPNGCGAVIAVAAGVNTVVTVTVQWDDSPAQKNLGTSNPTPTQYIIQSAL